MAGRQPDDGDSKPKPDKKERFNPRVDYHPDRSQWPRFHYDCDTLDEATDDDIADLILDLIWASEQMVIGIIPGTTAREEDSYDRIYAEGRDLLRAMVQVHREYMNRSWPTFSGTRVQASAPAGVELHEEIATILDRLSRGGISEREAHDGIRARLAERGRTIEQHILDHNVFPQGIQDSGGGKNAASKLMTLLGFEGFCKDRRARLSEEVEWTHIWSKFRRSIEGQKELGRAVRYALQLVGYSPPDADWVAAQLLAGWPDSRASAQVRRAVQQLPEDLVRRETVVTADGRNSTDLLRRVVVATQSPESRPIPSLYVLATCTGPRVVFLFGGTAEERASVLGHIANPGIAVVRKQEDLELADVVWFAVCRGAEVVLVDDAVSAAWSVDAFFQGDLVPTGGALGFARFGPSADPPTLRIEERILALALPYQVLPAHDHEVAARWLREFAGIA